jgi:hypothetical protein
MGADIHLFVERKMPSGCWVFVANLNYPVYSKGLWGSNMTPFGAAFHQVGSRNYALFGRLASVRGSGREPQGLPNNVSEVVQIAAEAWEGDAHSHSWLSASDFADEYYGVYALEEDEPMTEYHQNTLKVNKNYAVLLFLQEMCNVAGVEDSEQADKFRFVFWFDN